MLICNKGALTVIGPVVVVMLLDEAVMTPVPLRIGAGVIKLDVPLIGDSVPLSTPVLNQLAVRAPTRLLNLS